MESSDLRVFARIAETGSLSAAARAMKAPKSTLSRALARLEQDAGAALFERSTRNLRLTDAGLLLRPYALRVLNDLDEAESALEGFGGSPRGTLQLNTTYAFAQGLIAPMLPDFLARYPEVSVELDTDHRRIDMLVEGTDLVVRVGPLEDSSLIARRLPSVGLWLCASPSYIKQRGVPKSPADLASHEIVNRELVADWTFLRGEQSETVQPRARLVIRDAAAIKVVLEGGVGLGFIPSYLASPAVASGTLVRVMADIDRPPIEVHALYPSHRSLSAKVRVFIDALVEHMRVRLAEI